MACAWASSARPGRRKPSPLFRSTASSAPPHFRRTSSVSLNPCCPRRRSNPPRAFGHIHPSPFPRRSLALVSASHESRKLKQGSARGGRAMQRCGYGFWSCVGSRVASHVGSRRPGLSRAVLCFVAPVFARLFYRSSVVWRGWNRRREPTVILLRRSCAKGRALVVEFHRGRSRLANPAGP